MSQVAAALTMNPSTGAQEPSAPTSRTVRHGTSTPTDALRDSEGVRSNSLDPSAPRSAHKLFKDVLEKRFSSGYQQNPTSEGTGEEKPEKKKTKASIQDLSNIGLLSMNPAFVQSEKKAPLHLILQGTQSVNSAAKVAGPSVVLPKQGQNQSGLKEMDGKTISHTTQITHSFSTVNAKTSKDQPKVEKSVGGDTVKPVQQAQTDPTIAGSKSPSIRVSDAVSTIPLSELGKAGINPTTKPESRVKIDPKVYAENKAQEGSQTQVEELASHQEGKTSKKLEKTKTSSAISQSQADASIHQQVQGDGVLSGTQSQHEARQVAAGSLKIESVTNAVSSTAGAAIQTPGQQVAQAIREQLAMPTPQSEIQMVLNPPELGKIRISFQQNNQEITGLLEVDKLRTRAEIQRELPQVLLSLQNAGVQVRRLDVVMNNPNNNPSPDQNPGGQAFSESFLDRPEQFFASDSRHGSGQSGTDRSSSDFQSTPTPDNADQMKSFIRDDAINVYL